MLRFIRRPFHVRFVMLLLTFPAWPAVRADSPPEKSEPPLELEVELDGKVVAALANQPTEVVVGDKKLKLKVTAKPWRTFRAAGIEFRYPSGHRFEYEENETLRTWTLDGNDNTITVIFNDAEDLDSVTKEFLEGVEEGLPNPKRTKSPRPLRLGGREVTGTRFQASVADQILVQDIYGLKVKNGVVFLILADLPEKADRPTAETESAIKQVAESFRFTP